MSKEGEPLVDILRDALQKIAIYDQDERPLPTDKGGPGKRDWDMPFDWRRRSMKQERIARDALEQARLADELGRLG